MARLNESRISRVLGDSFGVRSSVRTVSSMHAQHGAALFITLDAPMSVTDARGERAIGRVLLVPPDLENSVHSEGPVIGICYDPERLPRLAARSRTSGTAQALDGRVARWLVEAAISHRAELTNPDALCGIAQEAATQLATEFAPRIDTRVAAIVEALRDPAEELPRLPITRSHASELFVRDIGVSIRTYRLWRRLWRALLAFARTDATAAAHASGFADLAHFSRTCRRMLGYSPTTLRDGL